MRPASEAVEYGPRLLSRMREPFVPNRDLSPIDLSGMESQAGIMLRNIMMVAPYIPRDEWPAKLPVEQSIRRAHRVNHAWVLPVIELGASLTLIAPEGIRDRLEGKERPLARLDSVLAEKRAEPGFFQHGVRHYLRLLVGRKILFPDAPHMPFDKELFRHVSVGLVEINNTSTFQTPPHWREKVDEARDVVLLHPQRRDHLPIHYGLIDILEDQLAEVYKRKDWEQVAYITASIRIIQPDGFLPIDDPEAWEGMKTVGEQLSYAARMYPFVQEEKKKAEEERRKKEGRKEIKIGNDTDTELEYNFYHVQLAQHAVNMAIVSAERVYIGNSGIRLEHDAR